MTLTRSERPGGDTRGNSRDRAARRLFLLVTFGDGDFAPCYRCGVMLDDETITVDRIVPGIEGGTYRRGNIRPACPHCNSETGALLAHSRKSATFRESVTQSDPDRWSRCDR